jgi:hypothetical protein
MTTVGDGLITTGIEGRDAHTHDAGISSRTLGIIGAATWNCGVFTSIRRLIARVRGADTGLRTICVFSTAIGNREMQAGVVPCVANVG